jgi:HTH-type transcriptional regulator / antitoxin HipB
MDTRLVQSPADIGAMVMRRRRDAGLSQMDLAGIAGTGNRFISELERGKGTVQLDCVLRVLDQLGLDVVIRERG